jgi:hypothetical protein
MTPPVGMINGAMADADRNPAAEGSNDDAAAAAAGDRADPMGPPTEPCECWCMHCRRTFLSSEMWFQRVINDPQGFKGFWMCPTPNCGGAGFTFDIFPTDPDHPANAGWHYEEDDDEDDDEDAEVYDPDADELPDEAEIAEAESDWDPGELKWRALDEELGPEADEDIEGEEWKHGLQPGERPPEPDWMEQARREQEEEERKYDEPDRRPREVDWKDRDDRTRPPHHTGGEGITDDDIPF